MKVKDKSRVDEFTREIKKLTSSWIEIGIFGEAGSDILLRAGANEFGVPELNIPERSFIRGGFDKNLASLREEMNIAYRAVVAGKLRSDAAWKIIGESFASKIQRYVVDLKVPPNAPETIERKGSSNPLIDTGQMRDSITYRVVSNV